MYASSGVDDLAELATLFRDMTGEQAVATLSSMITEIDQKLDAQLTEIVTHPDLLALESAWRGLHFLVNRTDTGDDLKIKVLNIKRAEVEGGITRFENDVSTSALYRLIVENELGTMGGEPFGCLLWDTYVDHAPENCEALKRLAQMGADGQCVVAVGCAPTLFQMDDWSEVANPRDLTKIFQTPEYEDWRALRDSETSRHMCLVMPRLVAPSDAGSVRLRQHSREAACWINGVYALGAVMTRAFRSHGWFGGIAGLDGGGLLEGLAEDAPVDPMVNDLAHGAVQVLMSDRRASEMETCGVTVLSARKNHAVAGFANVVSLNHPRLYTTTDATEVARWLASPAVTLSNARFIQAIRIMMRDHGTSADEMDAVALRLTEWMNGYVDENPFAHPTVRARRPLRKATVKVGSDQRGLPKMSVQIVPHFQFEDIPEEVADALLSHGDGSDPAEDA
ncbi:MAG: type VI secretion system contractile sheath large subunit [Pseudomonadota bacterium]